MRHITALSLRPATGSYYFMKARFAGRCAGRFACVKRQSV